MALTETILTGALLYKYIFQKWLMIFKEISLVPTHKAKLGVALGKYEYTLSYTLQKSILNLYKSP